MMNVKDVILNTIKNHPTHKSTDIVADVIDECVANSIALPNCVSNTLFDMAKEGLLIEIDYVVPCSDRAKSLFFTADTEVVVHGGL